MAGSFGFEAGERYEVAMRAGERVLLPAVRQAEPATLIITDGFSCQEQISQSTERHGLHLAQVLQMALREGPAGPTGASPEQGYVEDHRRTTMRSGLLKITAGLIGLLISWLMMRRLKKGKGHAAQTA